MKQFSNNFRKVLKGIVFKKHTNWICDLILLESSKLKDIFYLTLCFCFFHYHRFFDINEEWEGGTTKFVLTLSLCPVLFSSYMVPEGKFNYQVLLLLKGETILSKHKEFFIVKDMDLLPSQRKHQPCPRPKLKSINK